MPSPRRRSSSCSSWADRKSSRFSSSAEIAARCLVARTPAASALDCAVLRGVGDGGDHDVGEVVVDQAVEHLAAGALACDDARGLEDAQVLADQRLRHAERVDEFVHAARRLAQLQHDRDPDGRGQRAQQVACGVEDLPPRQIRQRGVAVLVASSTCAQPKVETVFIMSATIHARYACQRRRVGIAVRRSASNAAATHRYAVHPWRPSSTPSRTWPSAVAWSTSPARSTAARSRRGTTALWASSSRRTSSGSGGGRWSPAATTSSAWTARSSCRARCGWPPVTSRCSTTRWSSA